MTDKKCIQMIRITGKKSHRTLLTIVESNFNIRIFHDLELGSLRVQRHFRRLCSNVADKQSGVTVLPPVFSRQRLQCEMLQVNRSQCRWRGWLWTQTATFAIVRLIYLNLYSVQYVHYTISQQQQQTTTVTSAFIMCKINGPQTCYIVALAQKVFGFHANV